MGSKSVVSSVVTPKVVRWKDLTEICRHANSCYRGGALGQSRDKRTSKRVHLKGGDVRIGRPVQFDAIDTWLDVQRSTFSSIALSLLCAFDEP